MKIALLHLSDIHVHGLDDPILKRAEDIASTCYSSARNSDAFVIVITGDIAFSGSESEYEAIKPFLNNIKKLIENDSNKNVEIVMVPGNHDCCLKPETKSRSILIQSAIDKHENAEDETVIDSCTSVQVNYFNFRDGITTLKKSFDHKLLTEYELLVANKVVRFSAINASWMSRIPEVAGQLVFPSNKFRDVISEPAELRFILIHHPLNWYLPNSFNELRTLINTHATAILSGHEHLMHSGTTEEVNSGKNLYFEAGALQPHESGLIPNYSVLSFEMGDTADSKVAIQVNYELGNEIIKRNEFRFPLDDINSSLKECFRLRDGFLKKICDPGGSYIHPDKEHLEIDDLFIFPELKKKKIKEENEDDKSDYFSVPAEEILNSNIDNLRLTILGEEKSGKTTLLFQTFKEMHHRGLVPLYIKADEVGSFNEPDFDKLLERWAGEQYEEPNKFIYSEKKKRVVLVDNIERLSGGLKTMLKFIRSLDREFDSVILTATTGFELSELVNKELAKVLESFVTYEITRFGHALRHKLIRKWCQCGQITTLQELDKKIHDIENVVNIVLGKNLVPSQPFYLLILLQSSEQNQQSELTNSSFAQYYEYLMTGNLKRSGLKRDEYDELFNYLSNLAWYFRSTDISEASIGELQAFNKQYSKNIFTVDLNKRLSI